MTEFFQRLGSDLWPDTYGMRGATDASCASIIARRCWENDPPVMRLPAGQLTIRNDVKMDLLWCAKWVDGGCRIIDTTPEYFAAMAQTKMTGDAGGEMHVPWPAFLVRVPSGVLVAKDGQEYRYIKCGQFEGLSTVDLDTGTEYTTTASAYYCLSDGRRKGGSQLWGYQPWTLADILFLEKVTERDPIDHALEGTMAEDISDLRIRELSKRAVAGLLFTMQHTNNWKRGGIFSKAGTGRPLRREPPPHRSIIIGRPLSIDVTEAVRADARSGAHTAPSVQTLVRGHIKRQVVGVGRTGRKVVWIEPYWRGPEDAPILARPHLVGA